MPSVLPVRRQPKRLIDLWNGPRDPEGLFELPTHYFREGELTHVHDGVDEEAILSPVKERLGARK
jgi:hypothetical protein